ncbi:MAG: cadherin-like domain-containing protein, partial [Gemmatimonas sp.]
MHTRHCQRFALALVFALAACSERSSSPTGTDLTAPLPDPRMAVAPTANSACTTRWASGVNGAWTDGTKWSPAGVPGPTSSVCIDAPGTYMVTLDPAVDVTPVNILALGIGGASSTPTLRLSGATMTLSITQGILVQSNATLDLRATGGAVVNAGGTVTNQGTISAVAPCGGCGAGDALNADIINRGTLSSSATFTLGKVNGAYENSGTVTLPGNGTIVIPASAGAPTFEQNGGFITAAGNSNRLTMSSGTFTLNGGVVRQRTLANRKPIIVLDGANLVMAAGTTDSASIGIIAGSTGTRTITGDVSPLTTLWLGGPVNGQPGAVTFIGSPTNRGTILPVRQIDAFGGELRIDGTGRLTNIGVIDQSLNSGTLATFRYSLDITNSGTMVVNTGTSASFEKSGGSYVNAGHIDIGLNSGVSKLIVLGSTLTTTGTITGGTLSVDAGGRLFGVGASSTAVVAVNGGVVEPGQSPGLFSVYAFRPAITGALRIELGGTTAGTQYDQLDVSNGVFLQGALNIVELNGFQSGKCGHLFDVVVHATGGGYGTFGTVTGLNPAPGRNMRVVYVNATASTKAAVRLVGYDGAQKICVGPSAVSVTEGGSGAPYAIVLDHAPTSPVTVSRVADTQVTVSPASLTFTAANWQVPQFFTVTAVDDAAQEGAHTGSVTHSVTTVDATYQGVVPAVLVANITDNDLNLPPVAQPDAATTAEEMSVTINVLSNDSDPEGTALTISAVGSSAQGLTQITAGGASVRFVPATNFSGVATFTYTVADAGGMTSTANVSVTVTPVNDAPIAAGDQVSVRSAQSITVAVLGNDSDPDGDALTVTQASAPAHGTATVSGGQTIVYRSVAGYVGSDAFNYTIRDGSGLTATATVTVTVTAATPSVSYTLTSMWGVGHLMNGGGRTWAVRANFRGVTPVNTSAIVEFVLPPNVL